MVGFDFESLPNFINWTINHVHIFDYNIPLQRTQKMFILVSEKRNILPLSDRLS